MSILLVPETLSSNWTLVPITVVASGLWWKRYQHDLQQHQQKKKIVELNKRDDSSFQTDKYDNGQGLQKKSDLSSLEKSTSAASMVTKDIVVLDDNVINIENQHHNQSCDELVPTNKNETEQISSSKAIPDKKFDEKSTLKLANDKNSSIFYRPKGRRYTKITNIPQHRSNNNHEHNNGPSRPRKASPPTCSHQVVPTQSPLLLSKPRRRSRTTSSSSSSRRSSSSSAVSWTTARRLRLQIRKRVLEKQQKTMEKQRQKMGRHEDDSGSHTSVSS